MRVHVYALAVLALLAVVPAAEAQYFGRNKVQYDKFKFQVLATPHFDIHYYPEEAEAAREAARMAERWHARLTSVLGHELSGRQPLVLYASHPDFEQTNVIEGEISEGTGGVTEGAIRRIVLPMAATMADSDHVIGHELVHAFQYDILGRAAGTVPLWFIEGMAEYFSLGSRDVQTAMWLRDAAIEGRLPTVSQLGDPRYFPYRFGHAFWAYVGGRWGDPTIGSVLKLVVAAPVEGGPAVAMGDAISAIEAATGLTRDELSADWHASVYELYGIAPRAREAGDVREEALPAGRLVIGKRTGSSSLNVGPAVSPNGSRVAFLSARGELSIDFYVADAKTGRIIRRLIRTAADPHFESLQFLASAGAWDPEGQRLAVATVRGGRPVLAVLEAADGDVVREIEVPEAGEIFQPAWSANGRLIAFAAQAGGFTNLYVHDLSTSETRKLTDDAFADLQPAFSPDGTRLAFVTDRYTTDLGTLSYGRYRIAVVSLGDGTIAPVEMSVGGNAFTPQWSADSGTLYFVSDSGGRRNVWRLNLATGAARRITDEPTGVSGITATSPALSVAAYGSRAAITVFRDGGYELQLFDIDTVAGVAPDESATDEALLPPPARQRPVVDEQLKAPLEGLPDPGAVAEQPYSARLHLVGISQQLGVATGGYYGTLLSGGIALTFSDLLGEHLLGTSVGVNGEFRDFAAGATYINRTRRWNWGVFGEHVPIRYDAVYAGYSDGGALYVEARDIYREIYEQGGAFVAYPLSRVTRVELGGAARHIGFSSETRIRVYDTSSGVLIAEEREDLPAPESLNLFDGTVALVRDNAVFGATSPILGQRMRLDVSRTFGDLNLVNLSLDYRQYVMPVRPLTLAGRVLHIGRYGPGENDSRLAPLFLGYSTLVRGYHADSFYESECLPTVGFSCPAYDRLFGSRLLVVNLEARAPLFGLFNRRMSYGPVPVELLGFFDAGVAWTRADLPAFAGGTRPWVSSVGVGARVNALGFAILEFNAARPLDRPGRGWLYVFNLRPGF